jgi:hypothetical protein
MCSGCRPLGSAKSCASNEQLKTTEAARANGRHDTEAGILLNEHIVEDGPTVFAHACRLGDEGIVSKEIRNVSIRPVPRLDQGPQSRQHRGAAGAERDLE